MPLQPPTFSVVMPLYNKRDFVRRAVDSVLAQELADFELIVVDDGSVDASAEVLAGIDDRRLHVLRQPNAGPGAARNTGIARAQGRWVAFLDADDAWWPTHLAELQRVFSAFPAVGLVGSGFVETTGSALPELPVQPAEPDVRKVDYFVEAARRIGFINSSCVAVRRDALAQTGGFSAHRAGEDLEYWARVALGFEVAVSSRVTSAYFRGTGGAMEQLEQARGIRRGPLQELSPTVAMLCARAEADPALWRQASIRGYVNARLESTVAGALYQGDGAAARHYAALLLPPLTRRQALYRAISLLPRAVQAGMARAYHKLTPLLRRLQGGASS